MQACSLPCQSPSPFARPSTPPPNLRSSSLSSSPSFPSMSSASPTTASWSSTSLRISLSDSTCDLLNAASTAAPSLPIPRSQPLLHHPLSYRLILSPLDEPMDSSISPSAQIPYSDTQSLPPDSIRLSLNRTDEILSSSPGDSLPSLGLTSGDSSSSLSPPTLKPYPLANSHPWSKLLTAGEMVLLSSTARRALRESFSTVNGLLGTVNSLFSTVNGLFLKFCHLGLSSIPPMSATELPPADCRCHRLGGAAGIYETRDSASSPPSCRRCLPQALQDCSHA